MLEKRNKNYFWSKSRYSSEFGVRNSELRTLHGGDRMEKCQEIRNSNAKCRNNISAFISAFCILISALCGSCDLFEPRNADDPSKPAEWNPFPTTPYMCLENLVFAYNYRENVFNYGTILTTGFFFHFDPQDVRDFSLPIRWFKQAEVDMLMNVYFHSNRTQDMSLFLYELPNQPDIVQSNHAWIFREYILYINHTIPNLNNEFTGSFQLYLERESTGFWKIQEWHDFRGQSEWTFGRMKNAYGT